MIDDLEKNAIVEGKKAAVRKTAQRNRYLCWAKKDGEKNVVLLNEFDDFSKKYHWSVSDSYSCNRCQLCFQIQSKNKFTCSVNLSEKGSFSVCEECTFRVHNYLKEGVNRTSALYMLAGRAQMG
jgi:hypothetical protein